MDCPRRTRARSQASGIDRPEFAGGRRRRCASASRGRPASRSCRVTRRDTHTDRVPVPSPELMHRAVTMFQWVTRSGRRGPRTASPGPSEHRRGERDQACYRDRRYAPIHDPQRWQLGLRLAADIESRIRQEIATPEGEQARHHACPRTLLRRAHAPRRRTCAASLRIFGRQRPQMASSVSSQHDFESLDVHLRRWWRNAAASCLEAEVSRWATVRITPDERVKSLVRALIESFESFQACR